MYNRRHGPGLKGWLVTILCFMLQYGCGHVVCGEPVIEICLEPSLVPCTVVTGSNCSLCPAFTGHTSGVIFSPFSCVQPCLLQLGASIDKGSSTGRRARSWLVNCSEVYEQREDEMRMCASLLSIAWGHNVLFLYLTLFLGKHGMNE